MLRKITHELNKLLKEAKVEMSSLAEQPSGAFESLIMSFKTNGDFIALDYSHIEIAKLIFQEFKERFPNAVEVLSYTPSHDSDHLFPWGIEYCGVMLSAVYGYTFFPELRSMPLIQIMWFFNVKNI